MPSSSSTTPLVHTTAAAQHAHLGVRPALARQPLSKPTQYYARLALADEVRRDAYKLRYLCYLNAGHIQPNSSGLFKDKYDELPNASTIVIYDHETPLASVRTCLLARGSDLISPALDTYPEEVEALLNADPANPFAGRGIEVTRLVRSPEAENNQGLVFLLYRMAGYIALCAHSQIHLACVRTNHAPFYRRLGYQAVSEPRAYPGLTCKMQLMASDRQRYDKLRQKVPVMDPLGGTTGNLNGFFGGEPVALSLA
ncbi:N-acyl amino acid synthase FeeM domain-containing protein [Roseomonas marmotae]|uniref:N-acyl amino acid synthase FeeM domain-containing protein n=1 Tax=Roseomonas marmotae TaxID=2768161 RepID=UPI001A961293|nr:hypothetical protein [Roseomonas marmotae]